MRLADGAVLAGGLGALPGGTHEFGVRVADLMLGETTLAVLRDEVLAREPVVNLSRRTSFDAPDRPCSETHKERG